MSDNMDFTHRSRFFEQLAEQIDIANKEEKTLALAIVDIRNFRRINALYGFSCGNLILQQVHDRLEKLLRKNDSISKIGSDQYAIILSGLAHTDIARLAANKILQSMDPVIHCDNQAISVYVTIGIAIYEKHIKGPEQFLIEAEKALLEAKDRQIPFVLLESSSSGSRSQRWDIEDQLQHAIDRNELELHYQPVIDLNTGMPSHAEALMRWHNDSLGFVPPDIFIPAAERMGIIDSLTHWSINTALRQSTEWYPYVTSMPVSVNLSAVVINDVSLRDTIESALNIWGVLPARLTLEVTETSIIRDPESSIANLNALRELGVRISIDDFGTGYSSLEYFKNIPAHELKVDRSFIMNILKDEQDANIVQLVTDLAHTFDLDVVAEGVEDQETLILLDEFGCDLLQGYHFSKPLPQAEFIEWLQNYKPEQFFSDFE